jgi:hypothetical protein
MSRLHVFLLGAVVVSVVGCGSSNTTSVTVSPSPEAAKYLLSAEPAAAVSVGDAKKEAKDGEDITLVGRIGGSESPIVEGRASFTIVDTKLAPCTEGCPTPWDYCCDTDQLPENTASIKVVDEAGKTLPIDAKTGLGLKELQTIVVTGKAKRDDAGNLTVQASGIYVKK